MRDFTHEGFNTPGIMWFHLITLHIHLYCAIYDFYTDIAFIGFKEVHPYTHL